MSKYTKTKRDRIKGNIKPVAPEAVETGLCSVCSKPMTLVDGQIVSFHGQCRTEGRKRDRIMRKINKKQNVEN